MGTWISQVTCDGFSYAYNAASSSSSNSLALKNAIQAVIDAEYAAVGNASVPSFPSQLTYSVTYCSSDDGLSGADIAGIVVGSVVGALLLVGVIWYFAASSNAAPPEPKPEPATTYTSKEVTEVDNSVQPEDPENCGRACC